MRAVLGRTQTDGVGTWAPARLREQVPAFEDRSAPAPEIWWFRNRAPRRDASASRNGRTSGSRIIRNAQGYRHFGALTRRRGRRFGADLVFGTQSSTDHLLRQCEEAARIRARRLRGVTASAEATERRRNRNWDPRDLVRLLDVASQSWVQPPLRGDGNTTPPSGAGTPGRVNGIEPSKSKKP